MATTKRLPTRISISLTGLADTKTWQPNKYCSTFYRYDKRELNLIRTMTELYSEARDITDRLVYDIRRYNKTYDDILDYQKKIKKGINPEVYKGAIKNIRFLRTYQYTSIKQKKEEYKKAWKKVSNCKNAIDKLRASYGE